MAIQLSDDGTMDTVLRCSTCGEEFRFNYAELAPEDVETDTEGLYRAWVDGCISETESEHECPSEPSYPEEDDITSPDGRTFYQNGNPVVVPNADGTFCYRDGSRMVGRYQTAEAALRTFMAKVQHWPNVWIVSDHGNAHLMTWTEEE